MSGVVSMTGFATLNATAANGSIFSVSVKSVNHRHLDLQLRLAAGLEALEQPLRTLVRDAVRRGHVELTLTFQKAPHAAVMVLDEAMLAACVEAHAQAARIAGVAPALNVDALLRLPGVLVQAVPAFELEDVAGEVLACVSETFRRWNEVRLNEGTALAGTLRKAMTHMLEMTVEARTLRQGVADAQWIRLKQRVAEFGVSAGEERLLVEAALLVDRGEIEEELVRLETHCKRFLAHLDEGGEVGRPLDFLLQEIHREANTLLSKTGSSSGEAGLRLTEIGLAMKLELERAREQVQNLE